MEPSDRQAWAAGEGYSSDFSKAHANGMPRRFLAKPRRRKSPTKQSIGAATFAPPISL